MTPRIATLTLACLLIGCREQVPATSQGKPAVPSNAPMAVTGSAPLPVNDAASVLACDGASSCNRLPPGVAIAFPYEFQSERTYTNTLRANRLQVAFEFLEGDADAALHSFEQSMINAGFAEAGPEQSQPNGAVAISYKKAGYGVVHIWANPDVGAKPKNPKAKGVFGIDFPLPNLTTTN